jgi:hypothetical protein
MSAPDMDRIRAAQAGRLGDCERAWTDAKEIVKPSRLAWDLLGRGLDGSRWRSINGRTIVIASASVEGDGKRWLHVSVSHANHLPTWDTLRTVKDDFIGKDRKAVQIFPRASEYVNINPNVLHLWHCLDGDVLPDFTGGSGSI